MSRPAVRCSGTSSGGRATFSAYAADRHAKTHRGCFTAQRHGVSLNAGHQSLHEQKDMRENQQETLRNAMPSFNDPRQNRPLHTCSSASRAQRSFVAADVHDAAAAAAAAAAWVPPPPPPVQHLRAEADLGSPAARAPTCSGQRACCAPKPCHDTSRCATCLWSAKGKRAGRSALGGSDASRYFRLVSFNCNRLWSPA